MMLEDLARAAPDALARVMADMEAEVVDLFRSGPPADLAETYARQLRALNDFARRQLGAKEPDDT
jgi:hypothetical protein